jgi:hypothetical protein
MRIVLTIIGAIGATALIAYTSPARAANDSLTGKMAAFSYLIGGTWNCTTNLSAIEGQPARTDQGTATFDVVPGNVVHNRIVSGNYVGDYFFGYSSKLNVYWQVNASNLGTYGFQKSLDGKSFAGTASMGSESMQDTVTYTKVSPTDVTVHEVSSGGGRQETVDSACLRAQ